MTDQPLRRARLLRRDRRSGLQEDLPGAAGDDQTRPLERAGHRRGEGRLEPRPASRARPRQPGEARRAGRGGFRQALQLLRYIDGDYGDPATFKALRRELGPAAAPRPLSRHSARHVRDRGRSSSPRPAARKDARVIVEKPFGRDLASAQELNAILHARFDENDIFRIDHYLGKRPVAEHALLPLRQRLPRADLEPEVRRKRPDHDGGEFRRRRGAARSTTRPARSATSSRTISSRCLRIWRWRRPRGSTPSRCATKRRKS